MRRKPSSRWTGTRFGAESSGVARPAFAAHCYDEAHGRLGRHPRLVDPVMQLDGPVYMHQYKINAKAAFDGRFGSGTRISALGTGTT